MTRRFLFTLVLCLALCAAAWCAERATITVLATSDVHGTIYPYDYYLNRPANRGLAKVATLVKQVRANRPNALLVDCGDTIEGTPLAYVHAKKVLASGSGAAGPDPMMLVMNEMDYDAMVLGNHEFNFGLPVLLKAKKEARFEWLSANVTAAATAGEAVALRHKDYAGAVRGIEERVFTPMLFQEVDGVKVAIIGLTTPAIPNWERPGHIESYRFEPVLEAAREWVQFARQVRRADLVIVAAHLGLERALESGEPFADQLPRENGVYAIAREAPGIDAIVFGHTHQEVSGKSLFGVLLAQPKNWGQSLAQMDFTLERAGPDRPWHVVEKSSRTIPVTDQVAPDPKILELAAGYHEAAQKYLDTPVAEALAPIETRYGRMMDSAAVDAIHEVQLAAAKADVSLAALFGTFLSIPRGPVTVRQVAALYLYENTLVAVEITGRELKEALEHSARFFNTYDPAHPGPLLNPRVFGYNYDTAQGVSYRIDLTRPLGQRIVDLRFRGKPLDPAQKLRVAVSSYRKAGGGGYAMFRNAKVVWQSSEDTRQLMIDYYTKKKVLEAKTDNNWQVEPEAARKLLMKEVEGATPWRPAP